MFVGAHAVELKQTLESFKRVVFLQNWFKQTKAAN